MVAPPSEGPGLSHSTTLRPFHPQDVGVVKEITEEALGENYPLSLFLDIQGAWPEGFIIVERDGLIIGFLAAVIPATRRARILMLAVREGTRNQGIGTSLMEEFTRRCRSRGIASQELEVRKSNAGAIRFYERLGFAIRYLLPRFYTDGEDGFKMWKSLR